MVPSLFIGHGTPSLVLEDIRYARMLRILGEQLPRPRGIAVFSAHWESPVQQISGALEPQTIHDFFGSPEELYRMTYPATGDITLTLEVERLLASEGIPCGIDDGRGLDHGVWTVLSLMYPKADIPVVSLSVNPKLVPEEQYRIGKALQPLREQDILVIGSGTTVHNLAKLGWERDDGVEDWAAWFSSWLAEQVQVWNLEALFDYRRRAPHAMEAVPTEEHFAPLLLSMGAGDRKRKAALLHQEFQYGTLSLNCWMFS